jgi:hypothetical protein
LSFWQCCVLPSCGTDEACVSLDESDINHTCCIHT